MIGSIKWHETRPFDSHDLDRLLVHRTLLPGADETTGLLVVSRSGATVADVPVLSPEALLAAWQ